MEPPEILGCVLPRFRPRGLGLGGSGLRAADFRFGALGVSGSGFRGLAVSGFRVQGSGFRGLGV